jgi:hypothetical protein
VASRLSRAEIRTDQASSAACKADRMIRMIRRRRLDHLLAAMRQELLAHPVRAPRGVRDAVGEPGRQLVRVGDGADPEPQVPADLGAVVLDRPPGPLVQPNVGGRHLHLPGNEADRLVRQLRTAAGKPAVARVELQEQGEAQSRRIPLADQKLTLVIKQHPVLDELADVHARPIDGGGQYRRTCADRDLIVRKINGDCGW